MIKENKWKILLSSLATLLPMLFGLIVWNRLPEQMELHWGLAGKTDGYGRMGFVVFGLPLILFAVNLLCIFGTLLDKKHLGQNKKVLNLIFFLMPVLSLYVNGIVYATAFGLDLDMYAIVLFFLGAMLMFLGNYMPKCKQNFTMGIKVRWTLTNEENWNKTHRFAGRVWFFGGLAMLLLVFLPAPISFYAALILLVPLVFAPFLYSYFYHNKQIKEGRYTKEDFRLSLSKGHKTASGVAVILVVLILVGCAVLLFTGDVTVVFGEDSFTVDSVYEDALTVSYEDIESITLLENAPSAHRVMGFGSPRLSLGLFESESLDTHTRYTYTRCSTEVILRVKGDTLVLNGETEEATRAIYDTLLAKAGK